jgi:RNA polymerase sigma factor (sigma-70 family)
MGSAPTAAEVQPAPTAWPDARLVKACLRNDHGAWSALIDRYKNLIFSIPLKYGLTREEAADVFQSVCVTLLQELENLREIKALPKWIIQIAAHRSLDHKRQSGMQIASDADKLDSFPQDNVETHDERILQAEREQALRSAVAALPPRCQQLVRMLFYEVPVRPYVEIAQALGLAAGSIGFIRGRCLEKLRRNLNKAGYR